MFSAVLCEILGVWKGFKRIESVSTDRFESYEGRLKAHKALGWTTALLLFIF